MYSRAYVEITNICNRSCSFCPGHVRAPHRMSSEEFDAITDKLRGVTEYIYYHVMGEPLTHPLLCDFVESAGKKGFKSVVTTNGTLLGNVGDGLINAGIYKVNISVHSFEGTDTAEYLEYLNGCMDFADKASREGVLVILRLWNRGFDGGRNINTEALLRARFCDCEWQSTASGARLRHRLHLEYGERFDWPDMTAADGGERAFCYGLLRHFAILCDGTVVPCCLDRNGELALGNVFTEELDALLSSERAEAIREGFARRIATEELCRRCGYARRFVH